MPMDLSWIGRSSGPHEITWEPADCILYALGVGAGCDELQFTTENSAGHALQVLPTFATSVGKGGGAGHVDVLSFGRYGAHQVVHFAQSLELYAPISTRGRALATLRVVGIWDKRSGALIELENSAVDSDSRAPLWKNSVFMFIIDEGGFGGAAGPSIVGARRPRRPADHVVKQATRPEQALLFRLSGDRSPIHSDPSVAKLAGFERPILHGLCTFGFTARALLVSACQGDVRRFGRMNGRFAAAGYPGDELTTEIWLEPDGALFETRNERGARLLERGSFRTQAASSAQPVSAR